MRDKKILLICKETSSYPLYFLINSLQLDNNTIAAYFFMAPESVYEECDLNSSTYYKFKKLKDVKVYDFKKYAYKFIENQDIRSYDENYVNWIEKEFSNFKSLGVQLMTSQFTTSPYHFRNYFSKMNYDQQVLFLEYYYKNTIEIINEFNPDVILDYDDSELGRTVINEIAHNYKIPYISFEHPRYEKHKLFTYKLGVGLDKYFVETFKQILERTNHNLEEELKYIENYNQKINIMPEEYKDTITASYNSPTYFQSIKKIVSVFFYFYNQNKSKNNKKLKKNSRLLFPRTKEYIKFYIKVEYLKHKLLKRNKYFEIPLNGEKYIYMPLHLIPESTTFVKAPFYVNELNIIQAVSKALPLGWRLYVKEHQAMIGERALEFYDEIKKLPNVRLMQLNFYKDPKPWIQNSQGVITITGTSSFEASLLGKPSILFADVPHSLISSVKRVKSFEDLEVEIKRFKNYKPNDLDKISCATYIAAVKKCGYEINYKFLMSEGEKIAKKMIDMSIEYELELNKLKEFYYNAVEFYENNKNLIHN
jgi:hypothetical protein